MTATDDVLVLLPRAAVLELEQLLAARLLAAYQTDGGRPAPAAQRALTALHTAAHAHRSSVPGTPTAAPTTVDHGKRDVLGMGEAAAVLGCSPEYVRRLARTGRLRAQRVGGVWAVRPEDLDALRYGRTEDTDGEPGPAPAEGAADSG